LTRVCTNKHFLLLAVPEKNDAIVPEYSKSENLQLHEISTVALQAVHHGKA
jgi:hypothetical protein